MKASDLLVKCSEKEGVQYIFGIAGEENVDILDSLKQRSLSVIDCPVDCSENIVLTQRLDKLTCPVSHE